MVLLKAKAWFYIGIVPSKETKTGWQVIYFFKVSQNPIGKAVLDYFVERLECGYIKANDKIGSTDQSLAYVVRDFRSLRDKVIPFFEGKLLIKRDAFNKFKQVIALIDRKKHFTHEGIKQILEIAYSMNTGKRRVLQEEILKAYMELESSQAIR